jgi:hypothetical protein
MAIVNVPFRPDPGDVGATTARCFASFIRFGSPAGTKPLSSSNIFNDDKTFLCIISVKPG